MKGYRFLLIVGIICLAASGLLYFLHFSIFHDSHHIFIYLLGDVAYLPLEVYLVVVVIERVLARRETQAVLYKMNMVIGAFFSEIGNDLLADLVKHFDNREEISRNLNITKDWTARDFKRADAFAFKLKIDLDIRKIDLEALKKYLSGKRMYLLTLLENPNLLEHDRFTDLLWATTHLDEELEARPSLQNLSEADLQHLAVDMERMYDHLASEWLDYTQHLKAVYPFLYSLVLRTHPFQAKPSAAFA
ncbi:MAG: hypothetical protein WC370_01615 [Dehalococcoidales bacterium]|jgi:hypothetical protein